MPEYHAGRAGPVRVIDEKDVAEPVGTFSSTAVSKDSRPSAEKSGSVAIKMARGIPDNRRTQKLYLGEVSLGKAKQCSTVAGMRSEVEAWAM